MLFANRQKTQMHNQSGQLRCLRGKSLLLPLVKLSVLFHFESDDLVFQCLSTLTQVIIQLASTQTKHGQGYCNAQGGNLLPQVINALNFLKIERRRILPKQVDSQHQLKRKCLV